MGVGLEVDWRDGSGAGGEDGVRDGLIGGSSREV